MHRLNETYRLNETFDREDFIKRYWQQAPLLIPQAIQHFAAPISADELAGLACEDNIETRLIIEDQSTKQWILEHGPFDESRFGTLPESHWTLLVQAVDFWLEDIHAIKNLFRFIPDWRIDDVMISYATAGGSVGPHYDQYDVFLLQASGERRWQLGQQCDNSSALLPHDELLLLADFKSEQEYLLKPGDMLYVPPGVAHWGIAESDCMTFSIGFRAPSYEDIIYHFCDDICQRLLPQQRFTDAAFPAQDSPGELSQWSISRAHQTVLDAVNDRQHFADWFARYVSETKYPQDEDAETYDSTELTAQISQGVILSKHPEARIVFTRDNVSAQLFANGKHYAGYSVDAAFASQLCEVDQLATRALSNTQLELMLALVSDGVFTLD